jgi:histone H3/H4
MSSVDLVSSLKRPTPDALVRGIRRCMQIECDEATVALSDDAVRAMGKLSELFIAHVTFQAAANASLRARRTVRDDDVLDALLANDMFDFCIDVAQLDPDQRGKRLLSAPAKPVTVTRTTMLKKTRGKRPHVNPGASAEQPDIQE